MGLPSVFEVFHLAVGPSAEFTTGALRIGQAFRTLLQSGPYRPNNRILIELSGDFSKFRAENNSDQAVIAGLGGFTFEESVLNLKVFYGKIKENGYFSFKGEVWPFNPESDLIGNESGKKSSFPNTIRFHLIGTDGQPVFQTEYFSFENGSIGGRGLPEPVSINQRNSPENLTEIQEILKIEGISLLEYITSGECALHRISRDHFQKRMMATWKLMMANIDRGLKEPSLTGDRLDRKANRIFRDYPLHLSSNPLAGGDTIRPSIYALALSEEILNNSPVITAPTCAGSAIVPSVLRYIQEKFMFPDEKMVDGLTICGFFGSLILGQMKESGFSMNIRTEVACSAVMASAGVAYLIGGTISEIAKAASMAAIFYNRNPQVSNHFEPKSFSLLNMMVAQALPSLADSSRILPDSMIPKFEDSLNSLFLT